MKQSLFIIGILLSGSLSFAAALTNTHWSLKEIRCASGPSPFIPSNMRYDLHFLEDKKFEIAILRPYDWFIARGEVRMNGFGQVCLTSTESISSGRPAEPHIGETHCYDYQQTPELLTLSLTVSSPNGGDCPQDVPASYIFNKM